MRTTTNFRNAALLACLCATLASPALGLSLITNGGFEAGFAGWTRVDQLGSDGTFFLQTGTTSPVTAYAVPAPPEDTFAAMTDAGGPGSHVLLQTFTFAAPVPSAVLSFDYFVGNRDVDVFGDPGTFRTPNTLDFSTPTLNQQARVDILSASADPFSLAPADVLLALYRTEVGDALVSGYTPRSFDITAFANAHIGSPLTLRFAEVDNVAPFQFGVDRVALEVGSVAVAEPSSAALTGLAVLLLWTTRKRPVVSAVA